ncbi:unnamed protein product [Gadus morhua 'NCC']
MAPEQSPKPGLVFPQSLKRITVETEGPGLTIVIVESNKPQSRMGHQHWLVGAKGDESWKTGVSSGS